MITGEARHTRCVMGRLEAGEEVLESFRELARFERIDAGFVRAQGAVEAVELHLYDGASRRYEPAGAVAGPAELVSLDGNVSLLAGVPEVRLWAVLAVRAAGEGPPSVTAGFLARARAVYVEFAVDVFDDGDLERRDDPLTALPLWRPPRRR
jgi:predicted DNA-binding protein with PD1-like motif